MILFYNQKYMLDKAHTYLKNEILRHLATHIHRRKPEEINQMQSDRFLSLNRVLTELEYRTLNMSHAMKQVIQKLNLKNKIKQNLMKRWK